MISDGREKAGAFFISQTTIAFLLKVTNVMTAKLESTQAMGPFQEKLFGVVIGKQVDRGRRALSRLSLCLWG